MVEVNLEEEEEDVDRAFKGNILIISLQFTERSRRVIPKEQQLYLLIIYSIKGRPLKGLMTDFTVHSRSPA